MLKCQRSASVLGRELKPQQSRAGKTTALDLLLHVSDQATFGLSARFSTRAIFGLAVQTDYLTEGQGRRGGGRKDLVSPEKAADNEQNKIPWRESA